MLKMICYDKCSTCNKARKKLDTLGIDYQVIDVKKDIIEKEQILELLNRLDVPKRMFNTSGLVYREMELSKKVNSLTIEEMAELLFSHGMLIKRPVLFDEKILLVGYREKEYEALKNDGE